MRRMKEEKNVAIAVMTMKTTLFLCENKTPTLQSTKSSSSFVLRNQSNYSLLVLIVVLLSILPSIPTSHALVSYLTFELHGN